MPTVFNQPSDGEVAEVADVNQYAPAVNNLERGLPFSAGETGGTSTAYTATVTPGPSANEFGTVLIVYWHVDCGTDPTLALNGNPALSIWKTEIAKVAAGELKVGTFSILQCNGSKWFVVGGVGGSSGSISLASISDWPAGLTATELGYVDGVTSAIQTQLNGKAATSHTHTISQLSDWPAGLTVTELGYMADVTSLVQAQLNGKAATSHSHAASDITSGTLPVARGGTGLGSLGTALQVLRVNAGATALEFATPAGGSVWKGCVSSKTGGLYNVPATTLTTIGWDFDIIADAALHSTSTNNSRLIADSGGTWELTFVCYASDSAATLETRVYENGGANYSYNNKLNGPGNSAFTIYLSMTASQYVEIKQYASGSINVYCGGGALAANNNNYTRVTWRKVA